MTLYIVTPKTSHAITPVATGTTVKTVLQVATPSTTDIRVQAWGISFKGTAPSNPAGDVALVDTDVAATVTALSPEDWESVDAQSSLCVSGTSATGYDASAEGTITDSHFLDAQAVHPQSGYSIWFPAPPKVKFSRFLRIRCTFSVSADSVPWIIIKEPA